MRSAQELQNDLHRIQALLHEEAFLTLSGKEKERLFEDCLELVRKLDAAAETSLVTGILGGTGVGKSSLMNALAGSPIATTSHRRPHTHQVLIYHHAAMPLPPALTKSSQPRREITHEAGPVRHVLLCDLPDFDSLLTWHHEQVLQFLEHLDILIWVTTPEKYGDERFYSFLRQVPKARQNFFFVLNKVDLLFPNGEPGTGHSKLSAIMATFGRHLRDSGVVEPAIYALSASECCEPATLSPWNEFSNFRDQIFRLRDAKETQEIKTANLEVEVNQLTEILDKEVLGLNILHGIINEAVCELRERRTEWNRIGHEAFQKALEENMEAFLLQDGSRRALVGTGNGIAELMDWKRLSEDSGGQVKGACLPLHQSALQSLQFELERVEHRLAYQTLHRSLPASAGDHIANLFDSAGEGQALYQRLQAAEAFFLENHRETSFRSFRAAQYASYLALLACLLIALVGHAGFESLSQNPGWRGVAGTILALIQTTFSAKGFFALGSYLLLQTLLGFRFYRHYRKMLKRQAQRFVDSLRRVLEGIWDKELDALLELFNKNSLKLDARTAALRALRSGGD